MKTVTNCRVCGCKSLIKYLSLGKLPLANQLIIRPSSVKKYPLDVLYCPECHLSQLSVVVPPSKLYSDYPYYSSVSKPFVRHCGDLAKEAKKLTELTFPTTVDIASNDGCLLKEMKKAGFLTIGIEPSKNLSDEANEKEIHTINSFFDDKTASMLNNIDVVTATNVFAHVDDSYSFLKNVRSILSFNGVFIVEVPYLPNLIDNKQFDTIYHEHLSYFLLSPIIKLMELNGLKVFDVKEVPIHGGSIRVFASRSYRKESESIGRLLKKEERFYDVRVYKEFSNYVKDNLSLIRELMDRLKNEGKLVAGFGASAKGSTLLNSCSITQEHVSYIIDDTKAKQGKFVAGCNIPIYDTSHLSSHTPDYLFITPWNFADEIMRKTGRFHSNGMKYIIPNPTVRIV